MSDLSGIEATPMVAERGAAVSSEARRRLWRRAEWLRYTSRFRRVVEVRPCAVLLKRPKAAEGADNF
jgi:hypothetical protein